MSTLPQFVFPAQIEPESQIVARAKPQIQLDTNTEAQQKYRLNVPGRKHSRPLNIRTISTPPDSPTRARSSTTGSHTSVKMHDSGAITPPPTPTRTSHTKTGSGSSDFLNTISNLRRGDSLSSRTGRPSLDDATRPGSTETIYFPYTTTDYKFRINEDGKKKPVGVGAWSDVYIAQPNVPMPVNEFAFHAPAGPALTPPITPMHSRGSSMQSDHLPATPSLYAIKVPASTSAKKVLTAEAQILSYLIRFPNADQHIVPFYGQDTRNGALVLKAMDGTLEEWIQKKLNTLSEPARTQTLASVFPTIALSLIDSLDFLQSKSCIHADFKPSNILYSSTNPSQSNQAPPLVLSDFSSSILTHASTETETPSPLGAGTWTYLDPTLLSSKNPAIPSPATDLWSLAITLLFLVLGHSPYEAFKHNKFQQREMVKAGDPLSYLAYDDVGMVNVKRLDALKGELGFDVKNWLGKVLVKDQTKRVGMAEWRGMLVKGMTGVRL